MTIDDDIRYRESQLNEKLWILRRAGHDQIVEHILVIFEEIRQLERQKHHFESNREIFDKL